MRRILAFLTVLCAFLMGCGADSGDDCAFQARDGTCAVTVSSDGALQCQLDDAALCDTVTSFLEDGDSAIGSTSSALVSRGPGGGGGGLPVVCEPDGTFMCTCCDVHTGCYPCPKKDPPKYQIMSEDSPTAPTRAEVSAGRTQLEVAP